jgi:NADH-quinone oxidoreductase subunit B
MLMNAILELHEQILHSKLGTHRRRQLTEQERQALAALPTSERKGLLR